MIRHLTFAVLMFMVVQNVQGACEDTLSYATLTDPNGGVKNITSCGELVADHPYLCKQGYGKKNQACCQSCKNADLSCIDEGVYWGSPPNALSCADYVAQDPCVCQQDNVESACCASCQGQECIPQCRDYLSANRWIDILDNQGNVVERLTDCSKLIADYTYLCNQKYGEPGGHCCASCSNTDTDCIDDGTLWLSERLTCAEYVDWNPCVCEDENVYQKCCASCTNGPPCPSCGDSLSMYSWVTARNRQGKRVNITDCSTLVQDYLYLCDSDIGKEGGQCCQSCKGQDLSCIENPLIYWTVNGESLGCKDYVKKNPTVCYREQVKSQCCESCEKFCVDKGSVTAKAKIDGSKVRCKKCTCMEIQDKGVEFLKKACKNKKVQKKCCKMCEPHV